MPLAWRLLLRLYPAAFRNEYGSEMYAAYEGGRRDADTVPARAALWIDVLLDTLASAVGAHWDILRQDLHYLARTLGAAPGYTLTAIAVVALGVGANTAAFSLLNHVLLRPLPFPDADRLVKLWEDQSPTGYSAIEPSPANYRDWKRLSTNFETMAAYRGLSVNLVDAGDPERLEGASINAELFPMLGVQAALGRIFTANDDRAGAPGTVVLSHALWQRRFAGNPDALGRRVLLDGEPYVIIGVMPAALNFPNRTVQLWTALRFAEADFEDRGNNYLRVIAKLRRGVSLERAQAEMRVISAQLKRAWPKENEHVGVAISSLRDEISQRARLLLTALVGAALCVLLIACTKLANLQFVRALARRKELAVRMALGAGRERLIRQLLTESLLLTFAGALMGVLLGHLAMPLLVRLVPNTLPIPDTPALDVRVLAFAALISIATGVVAGVLPAARACGDSGSSGLREGSRAGIGGRGERTRSALVVAEITGSVMLLVLCGLLIRALWRVQATDPGFRPAHVLTLRTSLPMPKYEKTARRVQFYSRVLTETAALPGVEAAGYTSFLPIAMGGGIWKVTVPERPEQNEFHQASLRYITPGFLEAMGTPLQLGRGVSESDTAQTRAVAVVSESFVRKYWPHQDPLGRRFDIAFQTRTVVGVAGDIRVRGLERTSEPQVYLPYKQVPDGDIIWYAPKDFVVRASTDPSTLLAAIRQIIHKADPEQPISDVRTLEEVVEADMAPRVVQLRVLGVFAAIACLLAGIGIHGLLSFAVSQRSKEIGIRMALGATAANILRMIMREAIVLAAAGVISGAGFAFAAGRTMQSLLAGVTPADLPAYSAAIGLCVVMTLAGSLVPVLRAIRVDPTTVIRAD